MKRIFIDAENCQGCKNCSVACMQAHRPEATGTIYDLNLTEQKRESRNTILLDHAKRYKPLFCRHCDKPRCAEVCVSGALAKDPVSGLVQYDGEKCAQCFMCVMSCSFGVPKPDKETRTQVIKCDFCKDSGGEPSCVKVCRTRAIYLQEV